MAKRPITEFGKKCPYIVMKDKERRCIHVDNKAKTRRNTGKYYYGSCVFSNCPNACKFYYFKK